MTSGQASGSWRQRLGGSIKRILLPQQKSSFLQTLKYDAKILDVGCGNNSPFEVKTLLPACNYTGIDIVDYNQTKPNLADTYIVTTPEAFSDEICKLKGQFDAIISTHNIEHCNDREKTLDAMLKALRPGGQIYLLFPSESSVHLPHRGGTLNYYDDATHRDLPPNFAKIMEVIKANDFRVVHAAKRYRPLINILRGIFNENKSKKLNKVIAGTWAYHGFESLIWARRD